MPLNEADTRALLIDPKLKAAGWTDTQVTREHYYNRDHAYTAGRIRLRGNRASHGQPRRVDYLLRYTDAFPIALVEAKAEAESAEAGLEQAKGYARDLGLAFAYASNSTKNAQTQDDGFWLTDNEKVQAETDQHWCVYRVWNTDTKPVYENLGNIVQQGDGEWELTASNWFVRQK